MSTEKLKEPLSLYMKLLDASIRRHSRIKSRLLENGRRDAYSIENAATDTIAASKLSLPQIFSALIQEALTTPSEVADAVGCQQSSWDDFLKEASIVILWSDAYKRYPEVGTEDDRRDNYWWGRYLK